MGKPVLENAIDIGRPIDDTMMMHRTLIRTVIVMMRRLGISYMEIDPMEFADIQDNAGITVGERLDFEQGQHVVTVRHNQDVPRRMLGLRIIPDPTLKPGEWRLEPPR